MKSLIVRRDKIARYWFGRVAPLDFFSVQDGMLCFHDLAVDIGLVGARAYDVLVKTTGGHSPGDKRVHLSAAELPSSWRLLWVVGFTPRPPRRGGARPRRAPRSPDRSAPRSPGA